MYSLSFFLSFLPINASSSCEILLLTLSWGTKTIEKKSDGWRDDGGGSALSLTHTLSLSKVLLILSIHNRIYYVYARNCCGKETTFEREEGIGKGHFFFLCSPPANRLIVTPVSFAFYRSVVGERQKGDADYICMRVVQGKEDSDSSSFTHLTLTRCESEEAPDACFPLPTCFLCHPCPSYVRKPNSWPSHCPSWCYHLISVSTRLPDMRSLLWVPDGIETHGLGKRSTHRGDPQFDTPFVRAPIHEQQKVGIKWSRDFLSSSMRLEFPSLCTTGHKIWCDRTRVCMEGCTYSGHDRK